MTTRLRAAGSQGQSWDFETEHELARQETLDEILKELRPKPRVSVPGAQFGLSIATTVVRLTVPDAAKAAEIYVRTASIVFTRNGTDPTATLGIQADATDIILLNSRNELDQFKAIRQGGTSATLDVEYFSRMAD